MDYKNDIAPRCEQNCADGCEKECAVYTAVSVPVEITPTAKVGDISVFCGGDPEIDVDTKGCTYKVTITQKILIKIPVTYCVKTKAFDCDKK